MDLDRPALQRKINEQYRREHDALGAEGTRRMLDEASERWDLSPALAAGGVVSFAHVGVADCGLHVAAAVNACLDTGADTALAISVLHAFTDDMERARGEVADGGSPADHETWGVQGPGLDFREEWRGDHAMRSLRHFWEAAIRLRGISGRRLVERYPYLAGGRPGDLPNVEEVVEVAEGAVIVATGDQFHHGIGYGTAPDDALEPEPEGLEAARRSMEKGISLIEEGDHWGYNQHCVEAKSDDRDVAQLYRFLRGPLRGELVEIGWSDSTGLYDAPPPTWAGGGFIVFQKET
ncbi:MAG: hypothetical protein ACRDVL_02395 [Acidimicrobiia bacterium]